MIIRILTYHAARLLGSVLVVFIQVISLTAIAGKYNEHKFIGNEAIKEAFKLNPDIKKFFEDMQLFDSLRLIQHKNDYHILNSHKSTLPVTYGDLCGLAGDHVNNPIDLLRELYAPLSELREVLKYHCDIINSEARQMDDMELFGIQPAYATMAITDLSHFYHYGWSLEEHLREADARGIKHLLKLNHQYNTSSFEFPIFPDIIRLVSSPTDYDVYQYPYFYTVNATWLMKINSIARYTVLHTLAIHLAGKAGRELRANNTSEAISLITHAMVIEAFSEHFIQDAFSAGHLVVDRSFFGSLLLTDKFLHDFFGKLGLKVFNLRGNTWYLHGDGEMDHHDHGALDPPGAKDFNKFTFAQAENIARAIEASAVSLAEVFRAVQRAYERPTIGLPVDFFLQSLDEPGSEDIDQPQFYLTNYRALSCIPVPYGTRTEELQKYLTDTTQEYVTLPHNPALQQLVDNVETTFEGSSIDYIADPPLRRILSNRVGNALSIGGGSEIGGNAVVDVGLHLRGIDMYSGFGLEETWYEAMLLYSHNIATDANKLVGQVMFIPRPFVIFDFGFRAGVQINPTLRGLGGLIGYINTSNFLYKNPNNFIFKWNFRLFGGIDFINRQRRTITLGASIDIN